MAKLLETLDELLDWEQYREYLKEHLKRVDRDAPAYVSKEKLEFRIEGKTWRGHAVLAGPKAPLSILSLKRSGTLFREGTCSRAGKDLRLEGFAPKLLKEAERTFLRLRLGYRLDVADAEAGGDDPAARAEWDRLKRRLTPRVRPALSAGGADAERIRGLLLRASASEKAGDLAGATAAFEELEPLLGAANAGAPERPAAAAARGAAGTELARRAARIRQAVTIWSRTEEVARKELRKLQRAILQMRDPRGEPVIRGLETILTRLDTVDDEARDAEEAARRGDAAAFESARADFRSKMQGILRYVETDELIREADANPGVTVRIRSTITKSIQALMKAV